MKKGSALSSYMKSVDIISCHRNDG